MISKFSTEFGSNLPMFNQIFIFFRTTIAKLMKKIKEFKFKLECEIAWILMK
jgi:hypothetical protein